MVAASPRIASSLDLNRTRYISMKSTPCQGHSRFISGEKMGLAPSQLVERLVELAREAQAEKRRNIYDYQTNLVSVASQRGIKGSKGAKS